jgi:hypothetical protein
MTSNVIPFGPTFNEDWWTTEPELHSFDYEAGK